MAVAFLGCFLLGGCVTAERTEQPLTLRIETIPAGAQVSVGARGGTDGTVLGHGPLDIDGLLIVRKMYVSDLKDYWLQDPNEVLPTHPDKPPYASRLYSAGNDYPLELTFTASVEGLGDWEATLVFDRPLLERLYEEDKRVYQIIMRVPESLIEEEGWPGGPSEPTEPDEPADTEAPGSSSDEDVPPDVPPDEEQEDDTGSTSSEGDIMPR